jgi:hypothetical protein
MIGPTMATELHLRWCSLEEALAPRIKRVSRHLAALSESEPGHFTGVSAGGIIATHPPRGRRFRRVQDRLFDFRRSLRMEDVFRVNLEAHHQNGAMGNAPVPVVRQVPRGAAWLI